MNFEHGIKPHLGCASCKMRSAQEKEKKKLNGKEKKMKKIRLGKHKSRSHLKKANSREAPLFPLICTGPLYEHLKWRNEIKANF